MHIYNYPAQSPSSSLYRVWVNGEPVFTYATGVADFASLSFTGPVQVVIECATTVKNAVVRPVSRGIKVQVKDTQIVFELDRPMHLQIEVDGLKPLHFYGNPPESAKPASDDPSVLYFRGGHTYEVGRLHLTSNQTVYIEAGAVVSGSIFASGAQNIRICGRGVLDGSFYRSKRSTKSILLDNCENVIVEDIIMIEPTSWMVVLGACHQVRISNLKQIGEVLSSDGIDIVGCTHVTIENCFLKNNDDCVVIKSCSTDEGDGETFDWRKDVNNISIRNCVFMNDRGGNAMEIGHELRCNSVRNIRFSNIDVLHVHGIGAVFSIHNSDRAHVEDVVWENVRIEHCYDLFLDFRVLRSMWSRDDQRGSISNIHLKSIYWQRTLYNPGYTHSIIGGWNCDQPIRNIAIQDLYFDQKKISNQDEMDLFTKSVRDIRFI